MATNPAPPQLHNDVDTIRSILFGQQASEFQNRISTLETLVAALQEENNQLKKALDQEANTREDHETQAKALLDSTKAGILDGIRQLDSQIDSQANTDRDHFNQALENQKNSINAQIQDLQEKVTAILQAHQLKQDNLVDALAKALLTYQNES